MSSGYGARQRTANTSDRSFVYLHRRPLRLFLPERLHEKIPMGASHGGERSFVPRAGTFARRFPNAFSS
jgi:hypothetical protein